MVSFRSLREIMVYIDIDENSISKDNQLINKVITVLHTNKFKEKYIFFQQKLKVYTMTTNKQCKILTFLYCSLFYYFTAHIGNITLHLILISETHILFQLFRIWTTTMGSNG